LAEERFVSGFAAIVGRPNVGKSTLLNAFIGQKVAIISNKPQTTRNRIAGVLNRPHAQIIFLDTPGIHKPHHRLGEHLNRVAQATLPEVDVILFVVDGTSEPGDGDRFVANLVKESGGKAILVVNKMDRVARPEWYGVMDAYKVLHDDWLDVVPVSALEHRNLDALAELLERQMPEGPKYYPDEMVTDQPERQIVAELIREQVLHLTRDEIPHSVAIQVDEMAARPNGMVYVNATVYVERDSQKAIVIGAKGQMLKRIGALARAEIEAKLGSKIYLELFVKVSEDWRNRDSTLRSLGYQG
jgi:GTPase